MNPILMWLLKKGLEAAAFEVPFKMWQAEYREKLRLDAEKRRLDEEKKYPPSSLPPFVVLLAACIGSFMSIGASCNPPQWVPQPGDIPDMQIYCCDAVLGHPERCTVAMKKVLCAGLTPTPAPSPRLTPTPTPAPTATTPSPSPTRPTLPTPTATSAPTSAPTPPCVPEPGDAPVSIRQEPRCRPGFEPLEFQESMTLCGVKAGVGDHRTAWRLGYGIYRQGMKLVEVGGALLQFEEGRNFYRDALGRFYPDGITLYVHPEGPTAPYTHGGYVVPEFCGPTPAPTQPPATPTPPTGTGTGCGLPPGTGDGVGCPRTSSQLLSGVSAAIDRTIQLHPDWFSNTTRNQEVVKPGMELSFYHSVVGGLLLSGYCAVLDPSETELAVKNTNAFSEQYAVLSSSRNVRRGEGSYRATCTPAWSIIPEAAAATPAPPQAPPLLVLWRVGDDCSNPKDGNRYLIRHECVVGSTDWYRDPATPDDRTRDSSCDPDHPGWRTFCHERGGLDQRGPLFDISGPGAESWSPDESNPWQAVVVFRPGQPFTVCTRPRDDFPGPVLRPASQCKTQTQQQ